MKTKPTEPISNSLSTCGEVFHYLITALDLTAWGDAFQDDTDRKKRRESSEVKALSDQLRDWATEAKGQVPSRVDLDTFIGKHVETIPNGKDLKLVLQSVWGRVLDEHAGAVAENATFLDRDGTRGWYARLRAPGTLFFLWHLQKLLRRLAKSAGPMLDAPLDDLLAKVWPEAAGADVQPKHPLQLACYQHYAELHIEGEGNIDAKTRADWKSGANRPECGALGRRFHRIPDKLGLLLNYAFAGLLESLANTQRVWIPSQDWADGRELLLRQARCVHCHDEAVTKELARMPDLSLPDYDRLLLEYLGDYQRFLKELAQSGDDSLDLRVARFRVYEEYQQRILLPQMPPKNFRDFYTRLDRLWKGATSKASSLTSLEVEAELAKLRAEHPDWSEALAGPLAAIEARLALCQEPHTSESLQLAFTCYQRAFAESRYRAGNYTANVTKEALGLAALLHRHETGVGSIKPWIKKALAWWDLLGLGSEFDHEQPEQRIERAESRFTDQLHPDLRARLKSALPQLGLTHWKVHGLFGFTEDGRIEQLEATPVDRRQKNPMSETIVGRDQTTLMEAIDRGQLDLARELVRKGANLNFINSTGDTCVTSAFACNDYDLVLQILRRDLDPICRRTLLRVTDKMKISGLEEALSHGRVEILRELAEPKVGRRESIDMNAARVRGQTPLYYAVACLAFYKMSPKEAARYAQQFPTLQIRIPPGSLEMLEAVHEHLAPEFPSAGVLECINYLINHLHVDLDTPNIGDNSALTYAAERRLHDVAVMLLVAGANVNHRFQGGGTALVRAIINDDYELAKLLLEYRADYRLFVDPPLNRPICEIPMSEKMRRLIPYRP